MRADTQAQPAEYWDAVLRDWQRRPRQLAWRRYCDRLHAHLLKRWLPEGPWGGILKTDLFDEAVSEGLAPLLLERSSAVSGIDVSPAVAQAAAAKYPLLKTLAADVRHLPFESGQFDLVVSNSTLDHFADEQDIPRALAELARVLRPGGRLVVTMDNPANPALWLRNSPLVGPLVRRLVSPYQVGATLDRRRLERALQSAGLQVQRHTAILHCPRMPAVAISGWLERLAGDRPARGFLDCMAAFEQLERLGTRYISGYFVAMLAVKSANQI